MCNVFVESATTIETLHRSKRKTELWSEGNSWLLMYSMKQTRGGQVVALDEFDRMEWRERERKKKGKTEVNALEIVHILGKWREENLLRLAFIFSFSFGEFISQLALILSLFSTVLPFWASKRPVELVMRITSTQPRNECTVNRIEEIGYESRQNRSQAQPTTDDWQKNEMRKMRQHWTILQAGLCFWFTQYCDEYRALSAKSREPTVTQLPSTSPSKKENKWKKKAETNNAEIQVVECVFNIVWCCALFGFLSFHCYQKSIAHIHTTREKRDRVKKDENEKEMKKFSIKWRIHTRLIKATVNMMASNAM